MAQHAGDTPQLYGEASRGSGKLDHKDSVTQSTRLLSWVLHCYYHCLRIIWYRVCIAVITSHHLQMQYRRIVARPFLASIHPRAPGALKK